MHMWRPENNLWPVTSRLLLPTCGSQELNSLSGLAASAILKVVVLVLKTAVQKWFFLYLAECPRQDPPVSWGFGDYPSKLFPNGSFITFKKMNEVQAPLEYHLKSLHGLNIFKALL